MWIVWLSFMVVALTIRLFLSSSSLQVRLQIKLQMVRWFSFKGIFKGFVKMKGTRYVWLSPSWTYFLLIYRFQFDENKMIQITLAKTANFALRIYYKRFSLRCLQKHWTFGLLRWCLIYLLCCYKSSHLIFMASSLQAQNANRISLLYLNYFSFALHS